MISPVYTEMTFDPYEDGLDIMRYAQAANPQTLRTGDGWSSYNLGGQPGPATGLRTSTSSTGQRPQAERHICCNQAPTRSGSESSQAGCGSTSVEAPPGRWGFCLCAGHEC